VIVVVQYERLVLWPTLVVPAVALFFPQLTVPTEKLILPKGPPPGPNREFAMPKRKRTRAEDRAYRVQWERAINRARYAADPPPF
jgi:hypothetical protein